MQRRSFGRGARGPRRVGVRPSRAWSDLSAAFTYSGSATGTAVLVQLQSPAALSNLTSDPPEDLTVLRIRGSFNFSTASAGPVQLAMLVQDTAWTPTTFAGDSDKRLLWTWSYRAGTSGATLTPPGLVSAAVATTVTAASGGLTDIDVKPMVKVEAGKALYLVVYTAVTVTISSDELRVLYQRTGR